MSKNIQETIYEIIKQARQSGNDITKTEIKDKVLETPLSQFQDEHWGNDKDTKLDRMLDQGLYQLLKNERIKRKGRGVYYTEIAREKYKPVICRHIENRESGPYCPIKKVYIGDPKAQCELLHGTDFSRKVKMVYPMCPGYTDKNPTPVSIEYAKMALERFERRKN